MRAVVYGSRSDGHARVVIELFASAELDLIGLIDDYPENAGRQIAGLVVLGSGRDVQRLANDGIEGAVLGFGAARGRIAVMAAIEQAGLALPILVHQTAQVAASAELAPGCQVLPGATVGPGARIGRGALVNTGAIVDHDVEIGDAAVIGPGVILTGRVTVGIEAEIGAGAVVLPDILLGAQTVVGAGAVVTRDVPAGITVAGVPARAREAANIATVSPPANDA
jgi:sugar O-acyltransferase (sialic acid O-acetyltransferase NeuD family)